MKRSEMLSKIEKWLDKTYPDHYLYNDSSAKEFLSIIEELGMLPPETKATPEDFSNLDLRQDFLDEHDFTVNRWDEE